ncbi:MAG: twin-arginine translocation signal domain-containing protein, partial [Acidobacteriaceae bacterium]
MNRRTFLKVSGGAAALAGQQNILAATTRALPAIPSLADLASVRMPHTFMDLFNLPIAMNDWGYA